MKKGLTLAGRYNLQEELGQGLFGDAFLAQDEGSGLSVTIKTIPERVNRDERVLADVRRNFHLLQGLDHPNIVRMHALEFDALTQEYFLVREYVEGATLTEYRMRFGGGVLPVAEALNLCRQIAMALDHAHRSLLHRDLKPDNILISPTGEVKLLNFCLVPEHLAKEIRAESLRRDLDSAIRMHGYMAPEQFFGFPPPGPAADRYALAAIFFEMVSGRPVFDQADPQALMHAVCNMAPPSIKVIGKHRNKVLVQGLSKDPGKRYPSAVAFVEALSVSPLDFIFKNTKLLGAILGAVALTAILVWFFPKGSKVQEVPQADLADERSQTIESRLESNSKGNNGQSVILRVESRPSGAQVTLDGKRLGMTPLTLSEVAKGRYALKLEKTGFNDVVVDMELAEDTVVDLSLDAVEIEPMAAVAMTNQTNSENSESWKVSPETTDNQEPPPRENPTPNDNTPAIKSEMAPLPLPVPKTTQMEADPSTQVMNEAMTQEVQPAEKPPEAKKPAAESPEIKKILRRAEEHFRDLQLTVPQGHNAMESYQKVLSMDPGNTQALEGIHRIAEKLRLLAQEDLEQGRLSQPEGRNALSKVMFAREMDPENPENELLLQAIAAKYILLAENAAKQGDQKQVETRLMQAREVSANAQVQDAFKRLLHAESPSQQAGITQETPEDATPLNPNPEPVPTRQERVEPTPPPPPEQAIPVNIMPVQEPPQVVVARSDLWRDPLTGMDFKEIPEGCFQMGHEEGDADEVPVHKICLDGFRLSVLEVTQRVWKKIMGADNNPSKFQQSDQLPVDSVSWEDAEAFIHKLNEKAAVVFRLPTEAEWEYACRGPQGLIYSSGKTIHTSQANFNGSQPPPGEEKGEYLRSTRTVGSYPPNAFGLYDIHGNVYEWVEDWYVKDYYGSSPAHNPLAKDDSSYLHVLRGGAWHSNSSNVRCSYRYRGRPDFKNYGNGLRLASSISTNQ